MGDEWAKAWAARQEVLQSLLRAHGAEHHEWRVDLGVGRFWWQEPGTARPSVVARTKVLCSWALSNGSLLAAWANRSLPPGAAVDPVEGLPDGGECDDEGDAWGYALAIADGAGAEFVYRAPNAQMWIFLGLWEVRTAGPADAPFEPGPPWDHVRAVLDALVQVEDETSLRTLARNYGQTFVDSHVARGTKWEGELRSIGEKLLALSAADAGTLRASIQQLRAETPAGTA